MHILGIIFNKFVLYYTRGVGLIEKIKSEKPAAVMFDWAGVLVYDGLRVFETANPMEDEYGLMPGTVNSAKDIFWIHLSLGQITEEQFWDSIAERIGAHGDVPIGGGKTASIRDYLKAVRRDLLEAHNPYPQSFHLVEMYKRDGIPVGLVTNNCKEWLDIWEEKYGLSEMFDPIVASCNIGRRKPEPEFYMKAMGMLEQRHGIDVFNMEDRDCILVYDDQERNVKAADNAGLKGVLYRP